MKNILKTLTALLMISSAVYITSCVKGDFDEPPIFIPKVDFESNTTISQLKSTYTGMRQIQDDIIIQGIVVANDESGNLYKKLIIQDETGGIELALDKTNLYNEFKLGQRVFIKCKDMYIGDYNNLIQLGYVFNNNIGRLPEVFIANHLFRDSLPGNVPEPRITALNGLNTSLISTLLTFENVTFNDVGQEWAPQAADATNRTMTGPGGSLVVRTSKYSNFAGERVPAGTGNVTGVLSIFGSTWQLTIRDTSDVKGFSSDIPPPPPTGEFVFPSASLTPVTGVDEKFNAVSDNTDISLPGWTVQATAGSRFWRGRVFQTERYAQATAFQTSDPEIATWMITPPIVYDPDIKLSFRSAMAFFNHNGLSIWILHSYDGTNQENAVWEKFNATIATQASGDHNWVPSGEIAISTLVPAGYSGNFYIGFKYEGSPTQTTTYRIDDVLIGENGGGGGGGGGTGSGTQTDPYDVERAIDKQGSGSAWVKGYIVGTVAAGVNTISSSADIQFNGPFSRNTHVLLADSKTETNHTKMLAVNLPAGTAARSMVNLVDNPDNLGKWLNITGNLTTYFGIPGQRDTPGSTDHFELEDGGGGGGGGDAIFLETFATNLGVFTAHNILGEQVWEWRSFDGGCAYINGYANNASVPNEDWLVSPAISLEGHAGATISFREAINHSTVFSNLQILISTDYDGTSTPNTSGNWTELTGFTRGTGNSWVFVDSGEVSLSAYADETIYVAFRYRSTSAVSAGWEVSKVEIKE